MTQEEKLQKYTKALKLAGKLAAAVTRLRDADVFNLSDRMATVNSALIDYDEYIIQLANEYNTTT